MKTPSALPHHDFFGKCVVCKQDVPKNGEKTVRMTSGGYVLYWHQHCYRGYRETTQPERSRV